MNAKRLFSLLALSILVFVSACSPSAATPAPIAQEPQEWAGQRESGGEPAAQEPAVQEPAAEKPATAPEVLPHRPLATRAAMEEAQSGPLPPDNNFEDYGVNPETGTYYDHLSTFALDVDTAAYTVARSYINDGMLPPYDAVRVEEFVNFFNQGYAAPRDAAFTIYADGAPAPSGFGGGAAVLRFGIQGYRVDEFERKPAVLTFVIDTSGSMSAENRLELVKRSLRLLVEQLDERDWVTIVAYEDSARSVLKPTNGSRKGVILDAISSLEPGSSTNVEAGLRLGYRHALAAYQEGATNRVILCSDGVANVGNIDAETILSEVQGYVSQGITLTSIGVGMGNFNDVLLEQLADRGDGFYAYVDTMDQARKVFVDDLTSTLQVIAKDAKVQVDFNDEVVESYRLLGYENRAVADQDFRNDRVDAGELGAGHTATALYVVNFKPGADGRIATVQLRWEDPDTGEVKEINGNFNTWDMADSFESSDPHYQLSVTVGQFAEVLRESPYVYETSFTELAKRAWRIARNLEDQEASEFAGLVEQAARLR